jgi:hypothetical protein
MTSSAGLASSAAMSPTAVRRARSGLQLLAFSAAPGSASEDGLKLLATWAATAQVDTPRAEPVATEALDHR